MKDLRYFKDLTIHDASVYPVRKHVRVSRYPRSYIAHAISSSGAKLAVSMGVEYRPIPQVASSQYAPTVGHMQEPRTDGG